MVVTGMQAGPGSHPDRLPPINGAIFHNSAGEATRLPMDWELEPGLLEREAADEALATAFVRVVAHGGDNERTAAYEDEAWTDMVHRANLHGTAVIHLTGVREALEATGIEITEPTIDPSRLQDAA